MDRTPPLDGGSPGTSTPATTSDNCIPAPHTSLAAMGQMQVGVVVDVQADDVDAARLKALGICQGRRIQLVKSGDPLILRVLGTRVGLSARLARGITVEPCANC